MYSTRDSTPLKCSICLKLPHQLPSAVTGCVWSAEHIGNSFVLFNLVRLRARKRFLKPLSLPTPPLSNPLASTLWCRGLPGLFPVQFNPTRGQRASQPRLQWCPGQTADVSEDPLESLSPGQGVLQAGEKQRTKAHGGDDRWASNRRARS